MLDINKMTEEQFKEVASKAEEALDKYRKDIGNTSAGYDVLRYARAGFYVLRRV